MKILWNIYSAKRKDIYLGRITVTGKDRYRLEFEESLFREDIKGNLGEIIECLPTNFTHYFMVNKGGQKIEQTQEDEKALDSWEKWEGEKRQNQE